MHGGFCILGGEGNIAENDGEGKAGSRVSGKGRESKESKRLGEGM